MELVFFLFTSNKNPFTYYIFSYHSILQVGLKRIPFLPEKFSASLHHPLVLPVLSSSVVYSTKGKKENFVDIYIYMCVSIHREIYILMCIIYIHLEFPNFNVCCCVLRVRAMWGRKWRVTFTLEMYILFYNIFFLLSRKAKQRQATAVERTLCRMRESWALILFKFFLSLRQRAQNIVQTLISIKRSKIIHFKSWVAQ